MARAKCLHTSKSSCNASTALNRWHCDNFVWNSFDPKLDSFFKKRKLFILYGQISRFETKISKKKAKKQFIKCKIIELLNENVDTIFFFFQRKSLKQPVYR